MISVWYERKPLLRGSGNNHVTTVVRSGIKKVQNTEIILFIADNLTMSNFKKAKIKLIAIKY
jgi:hypothetical protein